MCVSCACICTGGLTESAGVSQVQRILSDRTREEINSDLTISVYDTERNEKAKQRRKELVSSHILYLLETCCQIFTQYTMQFSKDQM